MCVTIAIIEVDDNVDHVLFRWYSLLIDCSWLLGFAIRRDSSLAEFHLGRLKSCLLCLITDRLKLETIGLDCKWSR